MSEAVAVEERPRATPASTPASSVVEVAEGAPVVGTPARARGRAGGAQTLAPVAYGKVAVGERWTEV